MGFSLASESRNTLPQDQIYQEALIANDYKTVESVNSLGGEDFFKEFFTAAIDDKLFNSIPHLGDGSWGLTLGSDLNPTFENQFLDLIEETSKTDYDGSGKKFSKAAKRKEMRLPDMRYLTLGELVRPNEKTGVLEESSRVVGFVSFMVTYEDNYEVIYIYEILFVPEHQGRGFGGHMMDAVEDIGREVGVEKAMLTVFKSNERAVKWYYKRGYVVDEYSPEPRVFRDGTVKEPSYLILSKSLKPDESIGKSEDASETKTEGSNGSDDVTDRKPAAKRRRIGG